MKDIYFEKLSIYIALGLVIADFLDIYQCFIDQNIDKNHFNNILH